MDIFSKVRERVRRRRESNGHLKRANALYQATEFTAAAEHYRAAVEYEPDRAVLRYNLGLALYKSGERAAGREEWKRVVELSEGKNAYLAEQARILLRQFG